jgi:hypothetical protein
MAVHGHGDRSEFLKVSPSKSVKALDVNTECDFKELVSVCEKLSQNGLTSAEELRSAVGAAAASSWL